jgi:hypothetical protein
MKKLFAIALILAFNFSFAQTGSKQSCKVEFYLLKRIAPNIDTTKKITSGQFHVTLSDLQDTAFIKNIEITSGFIRRDTTRFSPTNIKIRYNYGFNLSKSAIQRINSLSIPVCCGEQFAVVVSGQICYTGYFWNLVSSFSCDWTTALVNGNSVHIYILRKMPDDDFKVDDEDPRRNKLLFDCLSATNRLIKN